MIYCSIGRAIEYVRCISGKELDPTTKSFLKMQLKYLMVKIQLWSFEECRASRHNLYTQAQINLE